MRGTSRVLVVGCGAHMITSLLPAMDWAGLLPAAACDPVPERAARVAERYGVPSYRSLSEALDGTDCRGAVIAVSQESNGELLGQCLERGLCVMVEKPPASTTELCRELGRLAAEKKLVVGVGFMKRYAPCYIRLKKIISGDEFSGPRAITIEAAAGPHSTMSAFITDYCSHYLDLACFLGGEVRSVTAARPEVGSGHVAAVDLSFSSGAIGRLLFATSGGWHEPSERVTVYGDGMRAEVSNVVNLTWYRGMTEEDGPRWVYGPNFHLPQLEQSTLYWQGYVGEMRQFRMGLMTGFPSASTLVTAAESMSLIEAVCQAVGE